MRRFVYSEEQLIINLRNRLLEEEFLYEIEQQGKLENRVNRILFEEEKITQEETERFIFPFEQSGYLTAEQKLELLLYIAEKNRRRGGEASLLSELSNSGQTIITEKEIDSVLVNWKREDKGLLSWEEKKEFLVRRLANQLGVGMVGILLRLGGDAIVFGEYFLNNIEEKIENRIENRIGVRKGDRMFRFPFLAFSSKEELERVIRNLIINEKRGEITVQNPVWSHERLDGTKLFATRPPASPHWGMKIVFGDEGRSI